MTVGSTDFYAELRGLLMQVPPGAHTTAHQLALALGDPVVERAVNESLGRPELLVYADRVDDGLNPFTDFRTDHPLMRLAEEQAELSRGVIERDVLETWDRVAGVDATYRGDRAYAACVVVDRSGSVLSEASAETDVGFPYVPGYFYWREGPALAVLARKADFDVLMVNAHGRAHPRRLGLASHLGVELRRPTIGISTQLLAGEVRRGKDATDVFLGGELVGVKLDGWPPLVVSVGHMVSLDTAVSIVRSLWNGSGLPRPLALAHEASVKLRRERN